MKVHYTNENENIDELDMDDERCNMDDISLKKLYLKQNLYDKNNHMCWVVCSCEVFILTCFAYEVGLHRYLPMLWM